MIKIAENNHDGMNSKKLLADVNAEVKHQSSIRTSKRRSTSFIKNPKRENNAQREAKLVKVIKSIFVVSFAVFRVVEVDVASDFVQNNCELQSFENVFYREFHFSKLFPCSFDY